jgi:hypothetical protein
MAKNTKSSSSKKNKTSTSEKKMTKEETVVEVPAEVVPAKKVAPKKKASEAPAKKATESKKKETNEVSEKKVKKVKKVKTARAATAYNIFMKDRIKTIDGTDQKEKLKTVAGMWKTLSDKDKEPFNKKASVAKVAFEKAQAENPEFNAKKATKRSPNAYNLFIKDRMPTATGANQTDKLKAIASEWKKMDDAKKRPFQKEADKKKEEAKKLKEESVEAQASA